MSKCVVIIYFMCKLSLILCTVPVQTMQSGSALPVRVTFAELTLLHRLHTNAVVRRTATHKRRTACLVSPTARLASRHSATHAPVTNAG